MSALWGDDDVAYGAYCRWQRRGPPWGCFLLVLVALVAFSYGLSVWLR